MHMFEDFLCIAGLVAAPWVISREAQVLSFWLYRTTKSDEF